MIKREIELLESKIDDTISLLKVYQEGSYNQEDPEFVVKLEKQVQSVILSYESLYDMISSVIILGSNAVDDFNKLYKKYNLVLELSENL